MSLAVSSIVEVSMNRITLIIHVDEDEWAAERVIIDHNVNSVHVDD